MARDASPAPYRAGERSRDGNNNVRLKYVGSLELDVARPPLCRSLDIHGTTTDGLRFARYKSAGRRVGQSDAIGE